MLRPEALLTDHSASMFICQSSISQAAAPMARPRFFIYSCMLFAQIVSRAPAGKLKLGSPTEVVTSPGVQRLRLHISLCTIIF